LNHSDIDVLVIHPLLTGPEQVIAVRCKSWQSDFSIQRELNAIKRMIVYVTNTAMLDGYKPN
jgi:hypothetical protein